MSREYFLDSLRVSSSNLVTETTSGNWKKSFYKRDGKKIYIEEPIENKNGTKRITIINGDTIYKEYTVKEGENTSKTVSEERNGNIVAKYKQYIKTLSNGQIVYSKTITYECDGKTSNKISSIEYIIKEGSYTRMDWFSITRCPYNDTSIVIAYSPYKIRTEKPLIACVVKCDYDALDNNSIFLPDYTPMPSYEANSVEYNWAQKVLKEKQEEYEALLSYKEI